MITDEKRFTKPRECRGGILADEMGMLLPVLHLPASANGML